MNSDLITLPRAEVEALRDQWLLEWNDAPRCCDGFECACMALPVDPEPHVAKLHAEALDALLAAAKPAIDAGVTQSEDEDVREDQPSCEIVMPPSEIVTVPRRGRYRWLVIAADAAEEGE
jgi:hypothetical protein